MAQLIMKFLCWLACVGTLIYGLYYGTGVACLLYSPTTKGNTYAVGDVKNWRIVTDGEAYQVQVRTQFGWRNDRNALYRNVEGAQQHIAVWVPIWNWLDNDTAFRAKSRKFTNMSEPMKNLGK